MILLYNPPSSSGRKPVLPMSLLSLGALLEGEVEYEIVDGNLVDAPLGVLNGKILERGVELLAVTVMPGPQLAHAVPLCRALRERHPALRIVWGGYFPTQHHDVCLRSGLVDYVVRGHGERSFRDLARTLRDGGDPVAIPGVGVARAGAIVAGGSLPPIPDPDELPDYPYHRVQMWRYARRTFMGRRTLPHHSSYGCPFLCNFCAVVNMVQGRWLAQSAERTARIVYYLAEHEGADSVEFYDNNFFVDEKRVAEFAGRIRRLGIRWWGEARIDTMLHFGERTWQILKDSGLAMVYLGAESGSDDVLRRMRKGGTASTGKTLEIAGRMAEYGIVPELSFVIGSPPDPERDAEQTIDFIRRVKRVNPRAEVVLYMYTPVPLAGELYESATASGFRFPDSLDEWVSEEWREFSQRRGRLAWVEDRVRRQVRDFEQTLHAYYPTVTDPSLRGVRRWVPRLASAWRYHLRMYAHPIELRVLRRMFPYQRPETSGF